MIVMDVSRSGSMRYEPEYSNYTLNIKKSNPSVHAGILEELRLSQNYTDALRRNLSDKAEKLKESIKTNEYLRKLEREHAYENSKIMAKLAVINSNALLEEVKSKKKVTYKKTMYQLAIMQ